jgi:hypothetical protein
MNRTREQRIARQQRIAARCAQRVDQVNTIEDGTLVVPFVSADPNSTVAAWARHLGIDLVAAKMMILSAEPGRCWIKYPGHTSVTAYG